MARLDQLEQNLRMQLRRDEAKLNTLKGKKGVALDISTNTKKSPADRNKFKAEYQKLIKEVEDLEKTISENKRKLASEKAKKELAKFDPVKGKEQADAIKEEYSLLKEAYATDKDPSIKERMDRALEDYKDVYSRVIGRPLTNAGAITSITGKAPTFTTTALDKEETTTPTAVKDSKVLDKTKDSGKVKSDTAAGTGKQTSGGLASGNTVLPKEKQTLKDKEKAKKEAEREAKATNIASTDLGLAKVLLQKVPSLKALLDRFVDGDLTQETFLREVRNDTWYRQNSSEIKQRLVYQYNYQDLQASGMAQGTTDYEKKIAEIESKLVKRAAMIGSSAGNDPDAIRKAAENLYITNKSEDESYITDFLAAAIKPVGGMIGGRLTEGYAGEALQDYQSLLQTARANGFQISDILPGGATEQQVLQNIAMGKIDINRVAQDARKLAAQGQPQYVRDLLAQGYNLDQVFQPYRQTMANILEIGDPNQIDLNDPTLRMGITDKGDMNLFDFKKALRRDNRWQYTEQAREDVSTAALNVLRDFGFQG